MNAMMHIYQCMYFVEASKNIIHCYAYLTDIQAINACIFIKIIQEFAYELVLYINRVFRTEESCVKWICVDL